MAELRRDPVAGRWVIIASERAPRPRDFQIIKRTPGAGFCPFCEGNEDKTPPEVLAYRDERSRPNRPGWRVRVVPNKYPALRIEGPLEKRGSGVYDTMTGVGAHEVFIESPEHVTSPSQLSPEAVQDVVWAYRDRMLDLKQDSRLVYALVFKNVGEAAGASLSHTHSQLICTPVTPKRVDEEIARCLDFHRFRGRCLLCDIIEQSLSEGERVIISSDSFVAIAPYASRSPFEMWILPRRHVSHFEDTPPEVLAELGGVLHEALSRLDASLDQPPYNYLLHTSPFISGPLEHYHWHLEVIPRVTRVAGFEWGTGFYINPVAPETAADYMRNVVLDAVLAHT